MFMSLGSLALLAALTGLIVAPIMVGLEHLLLTRLQFPRWFQHLLGCLVLPVLAIGTALGLVWVWGIMG